MRHAICIGNGYNLYMSSTLKRLAELQRSDVETVAVLRKAAVAGRRLAELKGIASTIPNQDVLINTLALQEAKDSSEIENIITTHDELFRDGLFPEGVGVTPSAKEVSRYVQAVRVGIDLLRPQGLLTSSHIQAIQQELEANSAGYRKLPGTALKNSLGDVVYTPPQDHGEIVSLMADLERFINDDTLLDIDPLVKMAIVHFQFENIHPFYDGNGRTGRIINILYLILQGLLDTPILYLSRHIVRTKTDYYRLLQSVRDEGTWEEWIIYMLEAVEATSTETIATVGQITRAMDDYKRRMQNEFRFYSDELLRNLFSHPYTKIEFVENDLSVSRLTATKYLEMLSIMGLLRKHRLGRGNYYVNVRLYDILAGVDEDDNRPSRI